MDWYIKDGTGINTCKSHCTNNHDYSYQVDVLLGMHTFSGCDFSASFIHCFDKVKLIDKNAYCLKTF